MHWCTDFFKRSPSPYNGSQLSEVSDSHAPPRRLCFPRSIHVELPDSSRRTRCHRSNRRVPVRESKAQPWPRSSSPSGVDFRSLRPRQTRGLSSPCRRSWWRYLISHHWGSCATGIRDLQWRMGSLPANHPATSSTAVSASHCESSATLRWSSDWLHDEPRWSILVAREEKGEEEERFITLSASCFFGWVYVAWPVRQDKCIGLPKHSFGHRSSLSVLTYFFVTAVTIFFLYALITER